MKSKKVNRVSGGHRSTHMNRDRKDLYTSALPTRPRSDYGSNSGTSERIQQMTRHAHKIEQVAHQFRAESFFESEPPKSGFASFGLPIDQRSVKVVVHSDAAFKSPQQAVAVGQPWPAPTAFRYNAVARGFALQCQGRQQNGPLWRSKAVPRG